jgi:hypothetical protein
MRLVAIRKGTAPKHALRGSARRNRSLLLSAEAGDREMGTCLSDTAGLCHLPADREDALPRVDPQGTGRQRPELDRGRWHS